MLLTGLCLFFLFDFAVYFSWESISSRYSEIRNFQNENFFTSFMLYSFLYFVSVSLSLPIVLVLTIVGGAIFNLYAFFSCLFSGTLGCFLVFWASKGILSGYFKRKVDPFMPSILSNFRQSPFIWLVSLRLLPILPIWLGNIVPGILNMKNTTFVFATILGLTPGMMIYISFGAGINRLLLDGELNNFSILDYPDIYLPLLALFLISCSTFVVKFARIKKA